MALLARTNMARAVGAKPVAASPVVVRPRSLVVRRAEPDLAGLAKQAIGMGLDAVKGMDKDQVRCGGVRGVTGMSTAPVLSTACTLAGWLHAC